MIFTVLSVREVERLQRAESVRDLERQARAASSLLARQQQELGDVSYAKDLQDMTAGQLFFASYLNLSLGVNETIPLLPKRFAAELHWDELIERGSQTLELGLRDGEGGYLAAAAPVYLAEDRDNPVGAIVVARAEGELSAPTLTLVRRVAPALAVGLLLALVVALTLSRRITRPLAELSAASDQISKGSYDVHLESARGNDELGRLAASFEMMAVRLKEADEHERTFLMRISHELRTPLTAIQGHVQAIVDGVIDDPVEREESLEVVLAESDRLQRLIGDLLDLAKLEARRFSLNHELVDLAAVCTQAVAARREEARAGDVSVTWSGDGSHEVIGDGDRLLQVVGNLLDNALRWTPRGGAVEVELHVDGSVARVTVTDTGPGVRAPERETIFRPFVTGDAGTGTGLGLPVAAELAAAMGGRLRVDDAPGGGARFTLSLPAAGSERPLTLAREP